MKHILKKIRIIHSYEEARRDNNREEYKEELKNEEQIKEWEI